MCQSANCDLLACSVYVLVLQRVIWRGIHLFILQRESIPIFTACAVFKSIWMLLWLGLFKCYSHANNRCGISLQLCRITRYKMYFPYNWKYQMKFPDGNWKIQSMVLVPIASLCTTTGNVGCHYQHHHIPACWRRSSQGKVCIETRIKTWSRDKAHLNAQPG